MVIYTVKMSSNCEHVALFSTETDKDLKQKKMEKSIFIKLNKPILIVCDSDETLELFEMLTQEKKRTFWTSLSATG